MAASYRHPEYLTSANALADLIARAEPRLRIYDCTVYLKPDPPRYRIESGLATYLESHVPSAQFLDLPGALSDAKSPFAFTLPKPAALEAAFRAAGIDDDSRVVLYSKGHAMWATRVWWMLHSAGHAHVSVLDGGFAAWQAAGGAIETGAARARPNGTTTVRFRPELWADKAAVRTATNAVSACTINALSRGVYAGTSETSYGRKGHIPGSRNVYYDSVLADGKFRSADEIRAAFDAVGALDGRRIITYCGGGISATIDSFALKLIGVDDVAVYDGSMSEWAADATLPLTLGESP